METKIEYEILTDLDLKTISTQRNITLFVHELERAFGKEKSSNFHHGMSTAEYERFVNDMWIGIILTMLMVLIVFSLCTWYMYHKFRQWKRHRKYLIKFVHFVIYIVAASGTFCKKIVASSIYFLKSVPSFKFKSYEHCVLDFTLENFHTFRVLRYLRVTGVDCEEFYCDRSYILAVTNSYPDIDMDGSSVCVCF